MEKELRSEVTLMMYAPAERVVRSMLEAAADITFLPDTSYTAISYTFISKGQTVLCPAVLTELYVAGKTTLLISQAN